MLSENMASLGGEQIISTKELSDSTIQKGSRPSSVEKKTPIRDREEKLRLAKERQNEERQRKIEELKAQAEAAQRYREQKEEERRRRIEELRNRDNDRRLQVEERKKAIIEAEKERREYILRKNQEREARLDAKKRNERGTMIYAFGSSTPRLLDPSDLGTVSPSAYWGHRRSTSITNVAYTGAPLTRRSSERDLADGSKKRATSAGGIDRQADDRRRRSTSMYEVFNWGYTNDEPPKRFPLSIAAAEIDIDGPPTKNKDNIKKIFKEETVDSPPISYRSVARRKTDLMPTIPSPRETSFGSKSSLQSHTPRTPGSRSGEVTPGGSINTSRPGSAMSTSTTASGLVQRRSAPPTSRKPRPASIAVTGVSLNDEGKHKKEKPPLPKVQTTPKRTNLNNIHSTPRASSTDSNKQPEKKPFIKKESTPQKHVTSNFVQQSNEKISKNTVPKATVSEKVDQTKENAGIETSEPLQTKEEKDALNTVKIEESSSISVTETKVVEDTNDKIEAEQISLNDSIEEKADNGSEKNIKKEEDIREGSRELSVERHEGEMTASMIARKITTEEEAKAALAERRRIAREEAERQAELERQRLEAERQAELKRQAEEEERQRRFEEETLRLAEEQRKAEDERLKQAIEEAKKREEAEKLKKEEEEKQKAEREEAERKAKEEAEKQRLEMAERLKREEKEREERRKRVEAIMSRTRAKGGMATPNSTPTKDGDKGESKEKLDEVKTAQDANSSNNQQTIQESEQVKVEFPTVVQQNTDQTTYEKSVTDKENALMKSFSNMIRDENAKNLQNIQSSLIDFTNGKVMQQQQQLNEIVVSHSIANGNGHIESVNKNDTNLLVDVPTTTLTNQLIDFSNESQQITDAVNFNNNNSLLTSSTTLVTADSHENKEISLL